MYGQAGLRGFKNTLNMKLKTSDDSIRKLVLDYFAILRLDEMGLLNDDFSLKEITGIADAVHSAVNREKDRNFQALVYLLSKRLSA